MVQTRDTGRSSVGVHGKRGLYSLLAGNAVSQVGNSITILAGPWFVLQTTGSAAKTGLAAASLAVGAVVPAFFVGRSSIGCTARSLSQR